MTAPDLLAVLRRADQRWATQHLDEPAPRPYLEALTAAVDAHLERASSPAEHDRDTFRAVLGRLVAACTGSWDDDGDPLAQAEAAINLVHQVLDLYAPPSDTAAVVEEPASRSAVARDAVRCTLARHGALTTRQVFDHIGDVEPNYQRVYQALCALERGREVHRAGRVGSSARAGVRWRLAATSRHYNQQFAAVQAELATAGRKGAST